MSDTPAEMGKGVELRMCDWRLCSLANHGRRRAKGNMADTGPHWLEEWMLPLTLGVHGSLGEDF